MICVFASGSRIPKGIESTHPTSTASEMPSRPTSTELTIALRSPMLMPKASPMIGNISGATIMAPITVAERAKDMSHKFPNIVVQNT